MYSYCVVLFVFVNEFRGDRTLLILAGIIDVAEHGKSVWAMNVYGEGVMYLAMLHKTSYDVSRAVQITRERAMRRGHVAQRNITRSWVANALTTFTMSMWRTRCR